MVTYNYAIMNGTLNAHGLTFSFIMRLVSQNALSLTAVTVNINYDQIIL